MKKLELFFTLVIIAISIVFSSCGKGYQVRVTNYNTEELDSVIIGKDIVFKVIERQATTDYSKIKSGNQSIKCITKTKKIYSSTISVPKKGTGKRTVQIDGLNSISILED